MDPPENIDKDREMAEKSFKIADKRFITDVARKIFEAGVAVGEKARARALPGGDQAMDAEDAARRARLSEAHEFLSRIPRGKYGILRIMPHPSDFPDEQSYVEFCDNDTNYQIHKRVSAKHRDRIGDAHGFIEDEYVPNPKKLSMDHFCWARSHATPRNHPGQWSLRANPTSMTGPTSKQSMPFQLEDVGYLNYVEKRWNFALLKHGSGLGKMLMAISVAELDKGLTIVVCPASRVEKWKSELASTVVPTPKVLQYTTEQRRTMMPDDSEEYDYIIISYDQLCREWKPMREYYEAERFIERRLEFWPGTTKPSPEEIPSGPLYSLVPHRVIADQIHTIRGGGDFCTALCALHGLKRIGISGTPPQSISLEWAHIFKFLRVKPLGHPKYFKESSMPNAKKRPVQHELMEATREAFLAVILHAISAHRIRKSVFAGAPTAPGDTRNQQTLQFDDEVVNAEQGGSQQDMLNTVMNWNTAQFDEFTACFGDKMSYEMTYPGED